jgi:hypothetical protein
MKLMNGVMQDYHALKDVPLKHKRGLCWSNYFMGNSSNSISPTFVQN